MLAPFGGGSRYRSGEQICAAEGRDGGRMVPGGAGQVEPTRGHPRATPPCMWPAFNPVELRAAGAGIASGCCAKADSPPGPVRAGLAGGTVPTGWWVRSSAPAAGGLGCCGQVLSWLTECWQSAEVWLEFGLTQHRWAVREGGQGAPPGPDYQAWPARAV